MNPVRLSKQRADGLLTVIACFAISRLEIILKDLWIMIWLISFTPSYNV